MTTPEPRDRTIAWLIFLLLFCCYLITYTGAIQSSDGLAMFTTAESLVRYGGVDSDQIQWIGLGQGLYGSDGRLYSGKGLGMLLVSVPLVWLAHVWPAIGLVQAALLVTPLFTAWTGALVFQAGRLLGWGRRVAVLTALLYGLATPAWAYTQTHFSDPVSAWGLFLTLYLLLCYARERRPSLLVFAGLSWALAYLTRPINLLTLPLYAGALLYILEPAGLRVTLREVVARRRPDLRPWRAYLVRDRNAWLSFAVPVVEAGILSLLWNWVRYGNAWDIGYASDAGFYGDWLFDVWGLIASPGRGLIWYTPALWLAVIGGRWFWRRRRGLLLFCLSLSVLYIAVYAKWHSWHGGWAWGTAVSGVDPAFSGAAVRAGAG